MISQTKSARKKIDNLINVAERLAAIQYQAGLHPEKERLKEKANKTWKEFYLATDSVKQILIKQENGNSITLD